MPTSQNGFQADDRSLIATMTAPGTNVQFPVRKGPCGALLMWAAGRWHREVEPLIAGTCWGYAERTIRGSSTELSNHASGTAVDFNAPKHPLGTNPTSNYTVAQIAAIHRIVADADGALRWGGDYGDVSHGGVSGSRPDGMHLEINAPEGHVAGVLAQVTGGVDMAPNTAQQIDEMHEQLLGVMQAWGGGITDDKNTPYNALMLHLRNNVEIHQVALMVEQLVNQPRQQVQLHPDTVQRFTAAVVAGVHEKTEATVADITHRAVVDEMATSGFWSATAERMLRAFAATLLPLLGAGSVNILDVPWETALGVSATAAVVSLLTSLVASQTGAKGSPSFLKGKSS